MNSSQEFRAMGAACAVSVYADAAADDLAQIAILRVELLEQSWSRFRESSELNRLNSLAGAGPILVSADLLALVWHMKRAWELTEGLFDPTMLSEIKAAGYDADYATVLARGALADAATWNQASATSTARSSAMGSVEIDLDASTVTLPIGVGLDPGAIGKGLAADIVANEILAAGATGILVDLGGDIVVAGKPEGSTAWVLAIEDERDPDNSTRQPQLVSFSSNDSFVDDEGTLQFDTMGIATSSTLFRRWSGGTRHHVIDPRTGQMADPQLVQATVWCGAGWLAEVSATAALLMKAPQAMTWLGQHEVGYTLLTSTDIFTSLVGDEHG
ncbi:MAG: FAD:protein FMN transferase [Actinomycetes bacterium]